MHARGLARPSLVFTGHIKRLVRCGMGCGLSWKDFRCYVSVN